MEKKGSVIRSRGFNIAFTLGELRLYFDRCADAQATGQGWVALFATAVCIIIKRHRKRSARRGATAVRVDRVDSQGEHENSSQLVATRSGRYDANFPYPFLNVEGLVREPPPAYIPMDGLPHDEVMRWAEIFQVRMNNPLWNAPH